MTNLFDLIDQGVFKKPRNKKEAKKRQDILDREKEEFTAQEALVRAVEEMSQWLPVARVAIFFQVHCTGCGSDFLQAELDIRGWPLIRKRHKRNGSLHEVRIDPAFVPKHLPLVVRELPATTCCCTSCISKAVEFERTQGLSPQLTLNLENSNEIH